MGNRLLVNVCVLAVKFACRKEYHRYHASLKDPAKAQEQLLQKLVRDISRTEYGKQYGVNGREDYAAFSAKLPIQSYEEMAPWIQRQLVTKDSIISPHPVIHIEPTSGSSGKVKNIPYTKPLLRSFSSMFRVWAYDLLHKKLRLNTGRIFISISPPTGQNGFTDDSGYIDGWMRHIASLFLVQPPKENANFLHNLALTLLQEEKLEVISIWSPSYLLALLEYITDNRTILLNGLPMNRKNILLNDPIDWHMVWPHLKMISCWDNALAKPLSAQLQKLFPNVWMQGKGLLATESPITIPLISKGTLPLLNDIFLEFETEDGKIKRLHELQENMRYQLIITQSAGLTRYRLGDIVEVQGFYQQTPSLTFVGRSNVCDMAGEKLNDVFIRQALLPLLPDGDFLLVPTRQGKQGYVLLVGNKIPTDFVISAESALCQSHHYSLARSLGQLAHLQVRHIPHLRQKIRTFHQERGMKMGDIKDAALITNLMQEEKLLAYCCNDQIIKAV